MISFLRCDKNENIVDPADTDQLLRNSNIEEGFSTALYWISDQFPLPSANEYIFNWTTSEAFSGTHSLMIQLDSIADSTAFASWYQSVRGSQPAGKNLILNSKIKTNLTGNGISLVIRLDDSTGLLAIASTQGNEVITGINDWHTREIILYDIPQGVTTIYVFLMLLPNTSGTVCFDDVQLFIND